jgi:excisionase family DNA binding protein
MAYTDSPRSEDSPLTTRQAAARLGVHERTVRRYIASGLLSYRRLPSGHYRVPAEAILEFWVRTDDAGARSSSDGAAVDGPRVPSASSNPRYRVDLWGRDSKVCQVVEEALGQVESDAAGALRRLAKSWPLKHRTTDWFALAYVVAIHLLRARMRGTGCCRCKRRL